MECKLEDIADVTMGQSPKSEFYNSDGEGIPFLQGNRTFGRRFPTFDTFTTKITKRASAGDVIMSVRAPVGDLNITPVDMCLGRGVCGIRMKNGKQDFLFYLMKYNMQQLLNKEAGTVFGSVNRNDINGLVVDIPDEEIQDKIASFLGQIDRKIENNEAINRNLEEQVDNIYKSWFIDFKQYDGVCPDAWELITLGEMADISSGKRPSMKQNDISNDANIPLVGAASVMGYTNEVLYDSRILVTGRVGTHGVIQRINEKCWPSDNTLVIATSKYEFVYQILKGIDYRSMNRGSTQPLITQGDLKKIEIIKPSIDVLDEFETLAGGLMKRYENNRIENIRLAELRDTLLPKLMSGELDVSEIVF